MSGPLRSKQGCWTCRLRKKKCDEGRPHCTTCESLSITCYGFGPKPEWLSNGEKERAVAKSLKEIVKHTSRRKATTPFSKRRDPVTRIAPKPLNGSMGDISSGPRSSRQRGVISPLDHGSSQEDGADTEQDESANSAAPERGDRLIAGTISPISTDGSVLLMHFLDNVFPLQYPMYKPGILEGGRGWLLAALLRTKSLYHAALALSAYHRRLVMFAELSHSCRVAAFVQQEKHLEICIESAKQFNQMACPKAGLGVMTSVVQLVFFELFAGHGNAWQVHLRAAIKIYQQGYEEKLAHGLAEKSRTILLEDLPLSEYEPVVTDEVVTFRFLAGSIIWLDITSSITAGMKPHLLPYHSRVITSNSQTKLEEIMGSKNWVMLQIGRIATLHEHKTQASQQGHFNCTEFEQIVNDISKEIHCGLAQGDLEGLNISECDFVEMFNTSSDQRTLVTRIFAYMASFYLHLVTHGFQKLEVLETAISRAMRILQTQISIHILPALVAPLYVIGSVARQGDEQFFRNIFSSPPLLDPLFSHRGRILPILEEIWIRRQTTPGFAWKDSLELTHDILLL